MMFLQCMRHTAHAFRHKLPARNLLNTWKHTPILAVSRVFTAGQPFSTDCKVEHNEDMRVSDTTSVDSPVKASSRANKFRQHVNPLASTYQQPTQLQEDWVRQAYAHPHSTQFIVDIGSAKGTWGMATCEQNPAINILGLEIRRPVVEMCLHRKAVKKLTNIHFLSVNANVDLNSILASLHNAGVRVTTVTIQFPDPHFKMKHKKRRLVNHKLVQSLASRLQPGTQVFMQSDIEELEQHMVQHFLDSQYFCMAEGYAATELLTNKSPFPLQTEREIATLSASLPVFRMMFVRNDVAFDIDNQ